MKKILLIQTAFIGDVILATALIEKLHQHYPHAKIDLLVRKGNEALVKGHPMLNAVWVWNKKENKQVNLFSILKKIRQQEYDEVINCQRFFSTGLLTAFSKGRNKIGFDKNPLSLFFTKKIKHQIGEGKENLHEVQRNHQLIAHLTDAQPALPKLYPSEKDFEKVKKIVAEEAVLPWESAYRQGRLEGSRATQQYICIAPTSVWFTKQLPAERWIALMSRLPKDKTIFLLGAPNDKDACEKIKNATQHPKVFNLAGRLSLLQSAALMRKAKMNYVNDSAPLHLASAMNAPVTAMFCSTVPSFGFTPLSSVRRVVETKEKLDCRPCGLHGFKACPKGHFKCSEL